MFRRLGFYVGTTLGAVILFFGCTAYMTGNMHLERENYSAAIESYREQLAHNPDHWQARQRLGYAYLKTDQSQKAIAEFEKVLEQKPGEPFSTYYLGLAYLQDGQRSQAIKTWQTYRNKREPRVEQEIKKQLTLVQMRESMHLAREALSQEQQLETRPPEEGTVAVFYFKDVSPDNSFRHLQKAMATMIITDLAQIQALNVLERMRVQFLLTEMQLGQTGIVESATAPRTGRLLGAEKLIVGTLEPGSLEVKTSVASTSKQEVVGAFSVKAELEQFHVLQKEIVYNILKLLKVPYTPEEEARFSKYHTQDMQAVIYFGQGLEALDAGHWKEARMLFIKASEADPTFMLSRDYRDNCPGAKAPTLAALSAMTNTQLAETVAGAVDDAAGAEAAMAAEKALGENTGQESDPSSGGDISFSW